LYIPPEKIIKTEKNKFNISIARLNWNFAINLEGKEKKATNSLVALVGGIGLEPTTSAMSTQRSNQLS
jgi:hypothetical protein